MERTRRPDPVVLRPAPLSAPLVALGMRGGSRLALPSGEVAAELCRAGSRGRGAYELRVVNDSREPITTYAYALVAGSDNISAWQSAVVPAHSSVALAVDAVPPCDRAAAIVAEVHAGKARLTLAAPPQTPARNELPARRGVATLALGTAAMLALCSGHLDPTGRHAAPARAAAPGLQIAQRRARAIPALDVSELRVPGSVQSGESVRVGYHTAATGGDVALIDESGRTLASTAIDARGSSVLVAPNVRVAQDLEVVVAAARGKERARAAAALFVRPAAPKPAQQPTTQPSAAPSAALASTTNIVAAGHGGLVDPIAVGRRQMVGRPIIVDVLAHPNALHLSLIGAGGATLAESDVRPSDGRVIFSAPRNPGELSLVATFERGAGEESTISPLSVRAH